MMMASGMDSRTMLGLLRGLLQAGFPASAEEFSKLAERIADEGKRRNIVAHAAWLPGNRRGSIRTFAIRTVGELRLDEHEFTAAELERLSGRIKSAREALVRFMIRRGYYSALRGTRTEPIPE
jgi:hypothetical protein